MLPRDKNYFDSDGTQDYLVFQPVYKYLEHLLKVVVLIFIHGNQKDCLIKKISSTNTSNYNQAPTPVYNNARIRLSFNTDLLKKIKLHTIMSR